MNVAVSTPLNDPFKIPEVNVVHTGGTSDVEFVVNQPSAVGSAVAACWGRGRRVGLAGAATSAVEAGGDGSRPCTPILPTDAQQRLDFLSGKNVAGCCLL